MDNNYSIELSKYRNKITGISAGAIGALIAICDGVQSGCYTLNGDYEKALLGTGLTALLGYVSYKQVSIYLKK